MRGAVRDRVCQGGFHQPQGQGYQPGGAGGGDSGRGDFHSYAPVWDEDWNRYPDAGALAAAGKETAYAAQVLCGTVDHMQMTQIVVMRYGARDKGTVLYALNADQYIKP